MLRHIYNYLKALIVMLMVACYQVVNIGTIAGNAFTNDFYGF